MAYMVWMFKVGINIDYLLRQVKLKKQTKIFLVFSVYGIYPQQSLANLVPLKHSVTACFKGICNNMVSEDRLLQHVNDEDYIILLINFHKRLP
jgi:hypothetical protein